MEALYQDRELVTLYLRGQTWLRDHPRTVMCSHDPLQVDDASECALRPAIRVPHR